MDLGSNFHYLFCYSSKNFCIKYYGEYASLDTNLDENAELEPDQEIYFVYPAKVVLFFQEIICKKTTIKHIPPGSDISVQIKLVSEGVDEPDRIDSAELRQSK
jgi:hypothetical protein